MAEVILPRSLAVLLPGLPHRATIAGATVAEVIAGLEGSWPGVADRLLDAGPVIREHINVFVDGDRAVLSTPVAADATVHVIPAIAGG
ncbi:MAG: MoaD/ThiS family protein [Candidatus Limnocylindrales bacterium]